MGAGAVLLRARVPNPNFMRIVYLPNGDKIVTNQKSMKQYDIDLIPFHKRVMKAYYALECAHKLRPNAQGKGGNKIKRIWENDAARTEAGLS